METTIAFSVTGGFIAKRAREIAWNDEDRAHAMKVLGCLTDPENPTYGLSGEAIEKILDGEATLVGDSRKGDLRYVEKEDKKWKAYIEKRRDYFAHRAAGQAEELIERKRQLETGDGLEGVRQFVSHFCGPSELTPEEEHVVIKAGKMVRVGGRKVPKHLLERYANVIRRQRRAIFSVIVDDPMAMFRLEESRVEIHDLILASESVNLVRGTPEKPNESETNFSCALHEWVNKTVGLQGEL